MARSRSNPDQPSTRETRDTLLALRRQFSRLTDEDTDLLVGLRDTFERHADVVVEAFYDHLMGYEALRALLANPATVERLKQAQRDYLLSLTSGNFDDAYAQNRLKIGTIHERIGLLPQWYLGTYSLYLDLLVPAVHEHYKADPAQALQAAVALAKRMILDSQLVLDAYYEIRQQKAVERSEHLAAIGELAASIAHEVRNPLAGMKGALEVMRRRLKEPPNQEVVDEVLRQIVRMEGLVRDLLSYARPRPLSPQHFNVAELLDQLLRSCRDESDAAGITVRRTYDPGSDHLYADPHQMEQVFINLLHNAIQAMEAGGTLTLSTRVEGADVVTTFQDTGKGIPAHVLPHVFTPFYTTKHRGSGLGLAIVKKIVEEHGGAIEIESEAGRGTTATVVLPQGKEDRA